MAWRRPLSSKGFSPASRRPRGAADCARRLAPAAVRRELGPPSKSDVDERAHAAAHQPLLPSPAARSLRRQHALDSGQRSGAARAHKRPQTSSVLRAARAARAA
eukprot:3425388-Prymnesium_polylepis.1